MTRSTLYPGASTGQWYAGVYPGSIMALAAPVVVLHTTEGNGWPSYSGGAVAPTLTVWCHDGIVEWRQHFPINMSARALMNLPGGVQTNTAGAVQVEMIGTCDPTTAARNPGWTYWPQAPAYALQAIANFLRWMQSEWALPLVSTSRPWLPYPSSYGSLRGQRMSFAEWTSFSGVCAHEHVPENDHGDCGALPIGRILALASGSVTPTNPITPPKPVVKPKPAPPLYVPQEDDMAAPFCVTVDGTAYHLVDVAGRDLPMGVEGNAVFAFLNGGRLPSGQMARLTSAQLTTVHDTLAKFYALPVLPGAAVA